MYTEEKNGFPMKDLLLKVLFLTVFVLLLMWLFPISRNTVNVKPLTDKVFAENVNTMKDAAKAYYINERLPKNNGEKVSMTLQSMYDNKLLTPFTDNKGTSCDTSSSYVEVTKANDKEYVVKAYLSCGKQADYVLESVSCNSCCDNKVADNKPVTPEKPITPQKQSKVVTKYEYQRTITNNVWSAWDNNWTFTEKAISPTLQRVEQTVVKGVKNVTVNVNELVYLYTRTITVPDSYTLYTTETVEATCTSNHTWSRVQTDCDGNCNKACKAGYTREPGFTEVCTVAGYPNGTCPTAGGYCPTVGEKYTLLRNYTGVCSGTTTKTEEFWASYNPQGSWIRTDSYKYVTTTDTEHKYSEWATTLPAGYTLYQTSKQYKYRTVTGTTSTVEKTWSEKTSLSGWTRTGKTDSYTIYY